MLWRHGTQFGTKPAPLRSQRNAPADFPKVTTPALVQRIKSSEVGIFGCSEREDGIWTFDRKSNATISSARRKAHVCQAEMDPGTSYQ
jgi:hypothetical protein